MKNKRNPKIRDYLFKVLEDLDKKHFVLYYYEAYSTSSCYVKMDFGVCNSLRIADYAGKAQYPYKFNLLMNLSQSYEQDGRHFYSVKDYDKMINDIVAFRDEQLDKYGFRYYDLMVKNKNERKNHKGFHQVSRSYND